MAQIESYGVDGQQASHRLGKFDLLWSQKHMDVIVQKSQSKAVCSAFHKKSGKADCKRTAIFAAEENGTSLNAPNDNMLQDAGYVDSDSSWHDVNYVDFLLTCLQVVIHTVKI